MKDHNRFDLRMTADERRATWGLGLLFSLRMLGMFMLLPVLTTYGLELAGATPTLLGVAIGIYGLAQACCQVPLGMASDRYGRVSVILFGLGLLLVGSVVAALSDSIWGVIVGRALQGAGAISGAVLALLSDLTREQNRTKAMAAIGMSFGITFAIAMVTGPLLATHFGIPALFWSIALLALLAMLVVWRLVPRAPHHLRNRESAIVWSEMFSVVRSAALLRLDLGIFCLHFLLMLTFVALPGALLESGIAKSSQWQIYLWCMLGSFLPILPAIIYAEKARQMRRVFLLAILLLLVAELLLAASPGVGWQLLGVTLFFVAFNLLEALLPSLVSKLAPVGHKGTAMGAYSTAQFLGVACGGMVGGALLAHVSVHGLFLSAALLAVFWWLLARQMAEPPHLSSLRLLLTPTQLQTASALQARLEAQPGVEQVLLVAEEQCFYLKVDTRLCGRAELETLVLAV